LRGTQIPSICIITACSMCYNLLYNMCYLYCVLISTIIHIDSWKDVHLVKI